MAPYDHTRPADQNSLWEESQTAFIMAPPLRLSGLAPLRNIPPTHRAAFTTGRPTTLDLPLTVISPAETSISRRLSFSLSIASPRQAATRGGAICKGTGSGCRVFHAKPRRRKVAKSLTRYGSSATDGG